jgi:hypothetical protein
MDKSAFNAQEWADVVNAPVLTALLIAAADDGGTVRESLAMSKAYAAARTQEHGPLLTELLTSAPSLGPDTAPRSAEQLGVEAPATLRRALAVLERLVGDDEVIAYKRFVYGLAEAVARAHREGGFLGFGGTEISEHEQAALDEIAAIFDTRHGPKQ